MKIEGYEGGNYRRASNWYGNVDLDEFKDRPIKYLEIGVRHGGNVISVDRSYGQHPKSKLYCIDPWQDYDDYSERQWNQSESYQQFRKNVDNLMSDTNKLVILRGFSHIEVPRLEDDSFDMIYIDANHEPSYVLEDAVLCFRKLKVGGILIFDDYGWGGEEMTAKGIDGFLTGYHRCIQQLGKYDSQVFIRKLSGFTNPTDRLSPPQ